VSNLAIIAPDYLEAFKNLSDQKFIELVTLAVQERGRSSFPTIGDLMLTGDNPEYRKPY